MPWVTKFFNILLGTKKNLLFCTHRIGRFCKPLKLKIKLLIQIGVIKRINYNVSVLKLSNCLLY